MRNLMLVCAGLALVSSVVAVNLWRELRAERVLTTELRTQLSASQSAPWVPAIAGGQLPQSDSGDMSASQSVAAQPDQPVTAEGDKPAPQATQNTSMARNFLNQQETMNDPQYRRAALALSRMTIPQGYPGLVEELGLTPEEAGRLFDVMAEHQLEMTDLMLIDAIISSAPDPAAREEQNRRRPEMQRRHDDVLMSMLGSSRYRQYQDYQQTRPARQQVVQLNRVLEGGGLPLTSEQSRSLTAAYIAEQKRQQEDTQRMPGNRVQAGPLDSARMAEERFELQEQSNRRMLEAARPHLSGQQLEAMQASLEQQLAMNRAAQRLSLKREARD